MTEDPKFALSHVGTHKRVPLLIGVNKDETSYFYPMIADAFFKHRNFFHETELIPRFLESATAYKGPLRDRVLPSILYTYFNGIDAANVTSVASRFINVSANTFSIFDEMLLSK